MTPQDPEALAARLLRAFTDHSSLAIDEFPELSEDAAYEVQRWFVRSLCAGGTRCVAGFKLSMTSPETQALAAASGPAYGTLLSDMILRDPAEISMSNCFAPRLELELQLIVAEDLSPGARRSEIEAKCSVAPGLEVPDSRFRRWFGNLSVGLIVSDLGLSGHVVVGEALPLQEVGDLSAGIGELYNDDTLVAEGVASTVMGDPVVALEWLTHRLEREGRILKEGTIVSSGTLCMPVPLQAGSYHAVYHGIGEVRLSAAR
ncbi:MAG: 2-keto-4-pentenoate hydratase [Actinomycetota bacterium]